jgi:hypothetical protein
MSKTYMVTFVILSLCTYTLGSAVLTVRSVNFLHGHKVMTFRLRLQSRGEPEVTLGEVRRMWWLGDGRNLVSIQKLSTGREAWQGALSWCRIQIFLCSLPAYPISRLFLNWLQRNSHNSLPCHPAPFTLRGYHDLNKSPTTNQKTKRG